MNIRHTTFFTTYFYQNKTNAAKIRKTDTLSSVGSCWPETKQAGLHPSNADIFLRYFTLNRQEHAFLYLKGSVVRAQKMMQV